MSYCGPIYSSISYVYYVARALHEHGATSKQALCDPSTFFHRNTFLLVASYYSE